MIQNQGWSRATQSGRGCFPVISPTLGRLASRESWGLAHRSSCHSYRAERSPSPSKFGGGAPGLRYSSCRQCSMCCRRLQSRAPRRAGAANTGDSAPPTKQLSADGCPHRIGSRHRGACSRRAIGLIIVDWAVVTLSVTWMLSRPGGTRKSYLRASSPQPTWPDGAGLGSQYC